MKTPPHPPKKFLTGHLSGFKKDPAHFMLSSAQEYGDMVMFNILSKKVFLLNHPDHVQQILQTQHKLFVKSPGYRPIRLLGGMGIFTSDGEKWIRQRKLYQPALSHESIKGYADNVIQLTNEMTASWKKRFEKGQNINISLEMSKITLDILSESLFSKRFEQDSSIWEAVTYSMKWIGERILKQPFVLPAKWPTAKNKKFHRSVKEMDDLIYQLIEERKQDPNPPNDLLTNFMQPKGDIQPFDAKELRDEMITIFIAGHETSANVLSWAFYLIGKHPDVKQKIKEEVDALGNRELQFQDLHELKYTTQVIKETMRLYPPVWHLGRMNVEEVEIGGYTFPKGSHLRMSPYVIHRDPKYWKNPDAFDPNRFSEDNEKEHTPYTFIPFGAGPRLCAGRNFAMMEMVLIVAKLVKEVPWELVSKNVNMDPVMTLRPQGKIEISA